MPSGAHSIASISVSITSAALAGLYAPVGICGMIPAIEASMTTAPFDRLRCGWAALARSQLARRLTSKMRSQVAMSRSTSLPGAVMPALPTMASMPPIAFTAASITRAGAVGWAMSALSVRTLQPAVRRLVASASSSSR